MLHQLFDHVISILPRRKRIGDARHPALVDLIKHYFVDILLLLVRCSLQPEPELGNKSPTTSAVVRMVNQPARSITIIRRAKTHPDLVTSFSLHDSQ